MKTCCCGFVRFERQRKKDLKKMLNRNSLLSVVKYSISFFQLDDFPQYFSTNCAKMFLRKVKKFQLNNLNVVEV